MNSSVSVRLMPLDAGPVRKRPRTGGERGKLGKTKEEHRDTCSLPLYVVSFVKAVDTFIGFINGHCIEIISFVKYVSNVII